jgi:hypothetical protein
VAVGDGLGVKVGRMVSVTVAVDKGGVTVVSIWGEGAALDIGEQELRISNPVAMIIKMKWYNPR